MSQVNNQNNVFDRFTEYQIRILFSGWYTEKVWQFGLSCIGFFFFCLFFHVLKWCRESIKTNMYCKGYLQDEERAGFIEKRASSNISKMKCSNVVCYYLISLVYYSTSVLLLLALTTFNPWICLSIVMGYSTGEILFFTSIFNLKIERK